METEKEKAKAGKLYDANSDAELLAERDVCKERCYELNRLASFAEEGTGRHNPRIVWQDGKVFSDRTAVLL